MQSLLYDDVMQEAFRRAQIRGRVFPQVCDFPSYVTRDVVETTYLAPLRSLGAQDKTASEPPQAMLSGAVTDRLELTSFSREDDDVSFVTCGGDAWAAALLLDESCAAE